MMIVNNALADERFLDHPAVTGEATIRFYAGVQLRAPVSNLPIGTLCIVDTKPRELSENQKKGLELLSNQVNRLLALRSQNMALIKIKEKLAFQNTAFENMTDGVVIRDRSGTIIDFNEAALDCLGLTASQLKGKTSLDPEWNIIHEDGSHFPTTEHPAVQALKTGQIQKNVIVGVKNTKTNTNNMMIA